MPGRMPMRMPMRTHRSRPLRWMEMLPRHLPMRAPQAPGTGQQASKQVPDAAGCIPGHHPKML